MATESFTERRVRSIVDEQPPGPLKVTLMFVLNEITRLKERVTELEQDAQRRTPSPVAPPNPGSAHSSASRPAR